MNILVAIDSTDASSKALQQALCLLNRQDSIFLLLSVEEPISMPSVTAIPGMLGEDSALEWQQEAELLDLEKNQLSSALTKAENACHAAGVRCRSRSEVGSPKQTICEIAQHEGCDLIVVGSHSYGWVEKVLVGSVSDYVVHHAHCAVLVVRE